MITQMANTPRLAELKIELTQECPLSCIHCSTRSNRFTRNLLQSDVVVRLLHEARKMGAKKVAFSGGEPLVYPELDEVLRSACSLQFSTSLYTTGIKNNSLDPLNSEDASGLVAAGLGRVIFSIYAGSAEVHDSVTGFHSYESTISAIKACIQAGLCVEFHFVPIRRNYSELARIIRLAEGLGVRTVSVLRFVAQGRGAMIRETEDLRAVDYHRLRDSINELMTGHGAQVRLGAPMNILGLGHTCCDAAQSVVLVDYRGQVRPCDAFKGTDYPDHVYGSILGKPLQTAWVRSRYLNAARLLRAERGNGRRSCPTDCLAQEAIREGGLHNLTRLPSR
jgi:MoaA/NifB/PqqE/SkfB family radical SAM enzyme